MLYLLYSNYKVLQFFEHLLLILIEINIYFDVSLKHDMKLFLSDIVSALYQKLINVLAYFLISYTNCINNLKDVICVAVA